MRWRFIDLGLVDPYTGPAVFEAIMNARQKNLTADTILFWAPNKPAIYVGFHQIVYEDIDVEACEKDKIPVIRRILGGGTGYCDQNQILYNIIYSQETQNLPINPREIYKHILGGVIYALKSYGIKNTEIDEERYSVYANNKKISGSGQLNTQGIINSGGSFLIDFSCEQMSRYLKNPIKNLREGIRKPEEGLTSLRRELNKKIPVEDAKKTLRTGFESVLGKSNDGFLTEYELKLTEKLRPKYLSREWTFRADNRRKNRTKNK